MNFNIGYFFSAETWILYYEIANDFKYQVINSVILCPCLALREMF